MLKEKRIRRYLDARLKRTIFFPSRGKISNREAAMIRRLLQDYSSTEVFNLFEPASKDRAVVSGISFPMECFLCREPYRRTFTKTKLFAALKPKWDHPICELCQEKKNQENAAREVAYSRGEDDDQLKKTQAFIDLFLNPTSSWSEDATGREKYESLTYELMWVDEREVESSIRSMDYQSFLRTPYWIAISFQVKRKASFQCQMCSSENKLHAHHSNYKIHGKEHRHINQITCLCSDCHEHFHDKVVS